MYNKLTDKQYNITIGIILLWGFLVNTIMCVFFSRHILQLKSNNGINWLLCSCISRYWHE